MTDPQNYDRLILKVLRGTSSSKPTDLSDIVAGVDFFDRCIITYEELEGGLHRLINKAKVIEASPLHYYEAPDGHTPGTFSGVTIEDYEAAYKSYRQRFSAADKESEPENEHGPLVVVRLTFVRSRKSDEHHEELAESLASQVEPALPNVAEAEIIGFEHGNEGIDILIYGRGTNAEVDAIYSAILPLVIAFPCNPGSSVVRYYDNSERELVTPI